MPLLRFIARPDVLPSPPDAGRLALIDLAFAAGAAFETATRPFLDALGARLAVWVDHHDHPAWADLSADPRFLLVSKLKARACPQLIAPDLVARAQPVDHLWAHADFDGCVAAAKYLRAGVTPYAEADEDARFADAPGKGFVCSTRGRRYVSALDQVRSSGTPEQYEAMLQELCDVLVAGTAEPASFAAKIDLLVAAQEEHRQRLNPLLAQATRPHPDILLLVQEGLSSPDKKFVLRELEERARVAVIYESGWSTTATFDDERLDLSSLPGLRGQRGYAFGQVAPDAFMGSLVATLGDAAGEQ